MTASKCRGRTAAVNAGLCQSCSRHDPDATGYVLVPSVIRSYVAGHDVVSCDDRLSADTIAPLKDPVCHTPAASVVRRNRWTLVLAVSLICITAANARCVWSDPGANPYTGNKAVAVRRLEDIPAGTRERLAELVEARAGRHVVVTRDQIDGGRYVGLRDMNFGSGRVCPGEIDRSMWPIDHQEGAMVFQEGRYAVLWFSQCGNVAWAIEPTARPSVAQLKDEMRATKGEAISAVAEPGTLWMIGAALIAVFVAMRRTQ